MVHGAQRTRFPAYEWNLAMLIHLYRHGLPTGLINGKKRGRGIGDIAFLKRMFTNWHLILRVGKQGRQP